MTGTTDTTVKPVVKTYTGFTSPAQQSLTIKGDGTASITYKYTRNSYTVTRQYRLENADGTFSAYTTIDSKKYKYGASVAVWNRDADTTYQAASIAAYTVPAKDSTLSTDVKRLTSTNNKIQYRLQNVDGSYPSAYTVGWSGTLRAGESHTWSYSQTTSHKAVSKTISYNGETVSVDVPRRTGRLVIKANGGTGDRTSTDIIYGSTYDYIYPLPTRTGYTLTGLYTDASGGTMVASADGKPSNDGTYSKDNAWLLTSDVTVYAQWTANETIITFDPQGGKNNLGSGSDRQSYFFDKDWNYVQLLPTKTGYAFEGYYTEKNGAGVKVYGTGIDPDVHPNDSTIYMLATPGTEYWKLINRTECIWQYTGSTLTVYANWLPNSYTVTFDGNGSTGGTMADESMTYDTTKALTANVYTRTGYTFSGWNTKADGSGTSYADKASVKNLAESGTVTLYAQWKANCYTITYNANGGVGTMTNSTATFGQNFVTSKNTFTRAGYTFAGWNEKADGSGIAWKLTSVGVYENGNGTQPWQWSYMSNITLYAQWTANTYTVTIPTAITYSNMPTGNVNVTNTYDISVDCKTGSFGDIIEVASTPSPMVSKSGKSNSLAVSSGSSKLPLTFTAAGTKQDQATITGTANTADVWTGTIQYTVTKK